MKKLVMVVGLAGLLLFSGTALADETSKGGHSEHGTTSHETHSMTPEEHKNMSTQTNDGHLTHDNTAADSHTESSSGGHEHGNVVETPPNIPVLAAFGAINAAFILVGIWNKWFRKKEVLA